MPLNSLTFNVNPSNIPGVVENLDGEAAFVVNGVGSTVLWEDEDGNALDVNGDKVSDSNLPQALDPNYMQTGVPFTTTSFNDIVDPAGSIRVKFDDAVANGPTRAANPESGNNNLILQAKAFYDLVGDGVRCHWLVVDNKDDDLIMETFKRSEGSAFSMLAKVSRYRIRSVSYTHLTLPTIYSV